ncbi:hypothetical protein GCM10023096_33820 [Nonomuraea ferruginea]
MRRVVRTAEEAGFAAIGCIEQLACAAQGPGAFQLNGRLRDAGLRASAGRRTAGSGPTAGRLLLGKASNVPERAADIPPAR